MRPDEHGPVIASVSGGKDSTAMCLHLREIGVEYRAVFIDLGWDHDETYRYITEELPGYIGPIETIRAEVEVKPEHAEIVAELERRIGRESPMVRLVLRKGMFPSGQIRYCTAELKVQPMAAYLDALDYDPINAVGIRAAESQARSTMTEWEEPHGILHATTWRPILSWSADDVVAIHQRHGVPPNRLYFRGSSRVGCWPCIRANKGEIRQLADADPDRIDLIRDLERVVGDGAAERAATKGREIERPSWFTARDRGALRRWPIDRVVRWARTASGGRTMSLFGPLDREFGCERWGMCEFSHHADDGGDR